MWHYGWHPFLCVWVPVREYLCLFWHKIHKRACARDLPLDRKEKGRKVSEISLQERSVKRRTHSAEGSRRDQSTEQVSQEMRVRQRGDQSTEVRKEAAGTCWPTDVGLTNAGRWVCIPSGFVKVSRKYTPAIACKCMESCTVSQSSSSWAWS